MVENDRIKASFKYPIVVGDEGLLKYSENDVAEKQRTAFIRGCDETRCDVAEKVASLARIVYDFFDLGKREINRENFVKAFRNVIYEE